MPFKRVYLTIILFFFSLLFSYSLPFDFTNNGELIIKENDGFGNPLMVIFVMAILVLLFYSVSQKDIDNHGKVRLDKVRDIPVTLIRGILEVIFSIVFFLILPTFVAFFCYFAFNLSVGFTMIIGMAVLFGTVLLAKKYYWYN